MSKQEDKKSKISANIIAFRSQLSKLVEFNNKISALNSHTSILQIKEGFIEPMSKNIDNLLELTDPKNREER